MDVCSARSMNRTTRERVDVDPTVSSLFKVNYHQLKDLCATIEDAVKRPEADVFAHDEFMLNYHNLFDKSAPRVLSADRIDVLAKVQARCSRYVKPSGAAVDSSKLRSCQFAYGYVSPSHDVQDYFPLIHGHRRKRDDAEIAKEWAAAVSQLRKLARRTSVERSREENNQMCEALRLIAGKTLANIEPEMLKELCLVAQLNVFDEPKIDVDASDGLYLILRGSVTVTAERLHPIDSEMPDKQRSISFSASSYLPQKNPTCDTLGVGDVFGVLSAGEISVPENSVLSVRTAESHCEFLLITSSSYECIMQRNQRKREQKKLEMIEKCKVFSGWSRQQMNTVAQLVRWVTYPPKTELAKEDELAENIAIIRSGECRILQQIHARLAGDKPIVKKRDIVMGKLQRFDSFGETSLLLNIPMTYTVVTSGDTDVELAVIDRAALADLDHVTLRLYQHSSESFSRQISQIAMEDEVMRQEKIRRWNRLKTQVMNESLYYCGIRSGVGKWKHTADCAVRQ